MQIAAIMSSGTDSPFSPTALCPPPPPPSTLLSHTGYQKRVAKHNASIKAWLWAGMGRLGLQVHSGCNGAMQGIKSKALLQQGVGSSQMSGLPNLVCHQNLSHPLHTVLTSTSKYVM